MILYMSSINERNIIMAKKSFLVLGAGRFGTSVSTTLSRLGSEVCVIDRDEDIIQDIADDVTHALIGDCCEETVLKSIGAANFDVAIIALSQDMKSSILATVLLKEMGVKKVIARATDYTHCKILEKVGADEVLMPEYLMGDKLAHRLSSKRILNDLELSDEFSIVQIECPHKWIDKNPIILDVRNKYNVNIIAIERGNNIIMALDSDDRFKKEDILVIIGKNEDIEALK